MTEEEAVAEAGSVAAENGAVPAAEVRDLDPPERDALEELLARYGPAVGQGLAPHGVLRVVGRPDLAPMRRVVVVRRERLPDLCAWPVVFLGRPLATLARGGARLTLEGGALVAPLATQGVVEVNAKGEQLFLYGRNLLQQSVVHVRGPAPPRSDVLVLSAETRRYLGIGVVQSGLGGRGKARAAGAVVVVKHRLDLGLYLRAQQSVPE